MKKKIILLGVISLFLVGCGKTPKLSNGDEAVVTFKDGNMISANEFYEEIKNKFGLETFVGMIDKFIYEKEFKDQIEDAKSYASNEIKSLRTTYPTDEDILSYLSYMGYTYQTVKAYEETLYTNYLQNEAVRKYVSDNITEEELKDYYEHDVYPNMTISHILITPDVTENMSEEDIEKKEEEAQKTIESIIDKLDEAKKDNQDITESFTTLAKEHSEDESTKNKGGDLGEINIGSLDSNYDELVKSASKLKDGEYSSEVITTELGYHVILKTKTGEKPRYEDSLDNMQEKITEDKLSKDQSLVIDAIKYYRELYEMDIIDSEIDSQYGKYMNNLINSFKNNTQSTN